ncbi:MAG: flagellar hook-basal body complex protein [Acetatifactor sp.]|nr:flagellar hook-basal body complex protein [Acetatifactor sp.]
MMRSLFSGVAGLKTHQTKMDVIGNNIANVNTVGFKSSSIVFSDLMSQTTQRASGANATTGTGGINARQIGLGVRSAAINMAITQQGASQSTGNPFDLMINGENFFVVSDGSSNFFTRDGSFYIDGAGNLAMTSNGYNVMGWGVDPQTGNIYKDTVTALRVMNTANMTYPAEATSQATIAGILDRNDTDVSSTNGKVVNLSFYDAAGYSYTAKIVFKKSDPQEGKGTEYSIELAKILDSNGDEVDLSGVEGDLFGQESTQLKETVLQLGNGYVWNGTKLETAGGETIVDLNDISDWDDLSAASKYPADAADDAKWTNRQILDEVAKAYGYEGSTDEFLALAQVADNGSYVDILEMLETDLANFAAATSKDAAGEEHRLTVNGRVYEGTTISFDKGTGNFNGIGGTVTQTTSILRLSQLGPNFSDITIDFSGIGDWNNKGTSTIGADAGIADPSGAILGTGRTIGNMIGLSIQTNGMIYASYDNGMTKLLGQIATAQFPNASGLEKQGNNLYAATMNSGEFDGIGVDITADGGSMTTGELEMSNVDLSSEFTQMITTQRGFQANSRIITVSDTLLEELTNLKR